MLKYYCDKCGKETPVGLLETVTLVQNAGITRQREICDKCADKLLKWFIAEDKKDGKQD